MVHCYSLLGTHVLGAVAITCFLAVTRASSRLVVQAPAISHFVAVGLDYLCAFFSSPFSFSFSLRVC